MLVMSRIVTNDDENKYKNKIHLETFGQNPIYRTMKLEKIYKGCEESIHEMILSDTQRQNTRMLTKTLKKLEKLLKKEANE